MSFSQMDAGEEGTDTPSLDTPTAEAPTSRRRGKGKNTQPVIVGDDTNGVDLLEV